MKVAIIGSGNVGSAIAHSAARAGHEVTITSRDTSEAETLAEVVAGQALASNVQAIEASDVAPNARVVKALNTGFAARQANPDLGGRPADGYVASDDDDAKHLVLSFIESIGLTPYDVGSLAVARTLEGMAWIHISLASKNNWPWQSAWRIVGPKG